MKNIIYKYLVSVILFMGFFSVTNLSYAQTWIQTQSQIKENTQQIKNIDEKIFELKDNYKLLYEGAKNQNDQLSNQISFAGYLLGGFSLFFTALGFFLSWYINRQFEKIKEMKNTVENVRKAIEGHTTDLYQKLKREETQNLLNRLEEVPEDITNICNLLLSRDLIETDYIYLRNPYLRIKKNRPLDVNAEENYMILFMQHFPYKALKDSDIKEDMIININSSNLNNMFSKDIKNFFDQILKYLKESNIDDPQNKIIIQNLFYNYSKSRFKDNVELQNYIKEILSKNSIQTTLLISILKEKNLTDADYLTWLDSIFT